MTIGGQTFTVTQNGPTTTCTYTISPTSIPSLSSSAYTGEVAITTSSNSCSWSATSNAPWITITAGSTGTGNGTVSYSVSANTTGDTRPGTMTIGGQTFTVTQFGVSTSAYLYFPHVDTSFPWQTEIALINTGDQTVNGTLRAFSDDGQPGETRDVTLSARGRKQIIVATEFTNDTNIGYIIFDTDSDTVQGYTKLYQPGISRTAIPAVKEVNSPVIYISHIASDAQWRTAISLVNTTSAKKDLTITFNNGLKKNISLNANEQKVFDIAVDFFNSQPQPDIKSAVINDASGVIGVEIFVGGNQMDGILLTGKTAYNLYYPHVAGGDWWTGIVAYNTSPYEATMTIVPYSAQGTPLTSSNLPIEGNRNYVGKVADLNLPSETAWFRIDSTRPLSGFELFGTIDGNQLAPYAGGGRTGAKAGVLPKIEKDGGWTGIVFVNTETTAASIVLTAYYDDGTPVATSTLSVAGHANVVNFAEALFSPGYQQSHLHCLLSGQKCCGISAQR